MSVSVILTILNEGPHLIPLLDSLCAQTRPADEIIICDGGSTDDTLAVLAAYADRLPLRVLIDPGANISRGRNVAIAAARYDIIAATDAGVRLDPHWLQRLIAPFDSDEFDGELVAGFFHSDPQTLFERALGATTLPHADELASARFLPSSRSVAFTQTAWRAVGGYPEWLDYSEDVVFDLRMKAISHDMAFVPTAIAHFRPRTSLRAFARQYYLYARGDGKADLWPRIHFIRYFTYLVAAPIGIIVAVQQPWFWLLGLLAGLVYIRTPIRRLLRTWADLTPAQRLAALALIPVIRVVGDVAKMLGYPVGRLWRWRNRHNPVIDWRITHHTGA